jgi:hypothetical protein
VVISQLDQMAIIKDGNPVSFLDGGQSVSDNNCSPAPHQSFERFLH